MRLLLILLLLLFAADRAPTEEVTMRRPSVAESARPADPRQAEERTCFQTHARWEPRLQLRSDVALCYGIDASIAERVGGWKAQGYLVQVMTGVAWGEYQDYLEGRFDGKPHMDEAQMDRRGEVIGHGPGVPYISPGEAYGRYLIQGVKRAIDAGAEAIHLEEPEYWVRGGYSESFKREWQALYHEAWIPPHTSPDAQYRASLLKYFLYRRALKQVFDFVKEYNRQTGKQVRCYVPTHSLLNYAQWGIVSPESSLLQVGADGYIAQVWTGTARTPNVYEGRRRERTFETAFLEYGAMMNVIRAGGGTVWFLNDPVEDNPDHSWRDYRANWESTLTASLLWPQVWRYEVMPWPERVFHGRYPAQDSSERNPGEAVTRVPIPPAYATELLTVLSALNDMQQKRVSWECGTRGVGVVVSDTMMFQRGEPSPSDPHLGSFYGLALPLLKRGLPVEPVQLENATLPGALRPYRVLLLTYEGMKPMTPAVNVALAEWVKAGGVLIVVDDDQDPYNRVRSWWNTAPHAYATPREHLFEQVGVPRDVPAGTRRVGKGALIYASASPAALSNRPDGGETVRALVRDACRAARLAYRETDHIVVRRGPYVVSAALDESLPGPPHVLRGHFLDLFDAGLPVRTEVTLAPGGRYLLLDLDCARTSSPKVLAAACKVLGSRRAPSGEFRFYAEGPDRTEAAVRIALPVAPATVTLDGVSLSPAAQTWDAPTRTLLLRFPNAATGHWIAVRA
jgi:hypothetical protein